MNYIVGDIGNTSTRICLFTKSKISKSVVFNTNKIFLKGFVRGTIKKFFKKDLRKEILFSCVVPKALKNIKKILKKNYNVLEIKKFNLKKLIKINIKNINQLGSDRIVNSIEGKRFNL